MKIQIKELKKLFIALALLALPTLNSHLSTALAQSVQPIYSFPLGAANPVAALTLGPDGNFYGTTENGGSGGVGTVFQVSTNGVLTTLVSFASTNGANPLAALTLGPDGNFYGTTANGGSSGYGTVFRMTTNSVLTTIYSFSATIYNGSSAYTNSDGADPQAALTLGPDGNFYGTTYEGGSSGLGTVFQLTTNGVLTTLVSFADTNGAYPEAALTLGPDGNFYGTTYSGGTTYGGGGSGDGTVFQVSTNGVLTTIYSFSATIYNGSSAYTNSDGADPQAALTLGPDGNFYGTTYEGGSSGLGTVFQLTTNGVLTTLVSFADTNGANPYASLTLGPDGNFYGTTLQGGSSEDGTVFLVTTNGILTTLVSFDNSYGYSPYAALILGPDGNFYGTTYNGGSGYGTAFRVTTNGVLTTLVSFGNANGADPQAALTLGPDGNFYGTTEGGGSSGDGTVFEVTTNGVLTTLYSFTGGSDGFYPTASLTLGPDGNFYGTTSGFNYGTNSYGGTVFRVTTNGVLTTLYSFSEAYNGYYIYGTSPFAALTLGPDGNFYGTTYQGGAYGNGTVFKVTTNGMLTTLYSFSATGTTGTNSDGKNPSAALTLGPDCNFYGTTEIGGSSGNGTVFRVTPNGALTMLYSFTGLTDGGYSTASLALGPDGNFYGTTSGGGSFGTGNCTVFRVTTNGVLTTLYSFTGGNDGWFPTASLTLGPDGNFYGTTEYGGSSDGGTVFQVTTNGVLTTLYSFTVHNGGFSTVLALTVGPDGNFYGTTYYGGSSGIGEIYLLDTSPPIITSEPVNVTLPIGDIANFGVQATGDLPLGYQWYFNTNTLLPSATNTSLVIASAVANDDGYYQVIVTNFFGSATSDVASLTVLVEPNMAGISYNPSSDTATLSLGSYPGSTNYVYATTNLALPISQWQLVATNVAAPDGLFQFIDTHVRGIPAKFYRLSDQLITSPITVNSVSPIAPEQTQTITISGSGFGTQSPFNGDSDYLYILDVTGNWEAGYLPPDNLITLNVISWTDSQIVISGFTGYYGFGNWTLEPGDNLTIAVWNPQTGAGPATNSVTVNSP